MAYFVKEAFRTVQGEGVNAGRVAVFCRFAGCNLWSGREEDRAEAACNFCDTEFTGVDGEGGGKFAGARELADHLVAIWGADDEDRFIVLTGGEPMLQVDPALVDALHNEGFEIAIESNGTIAAAPGIDWICVSPKAGAPIVQTSGSELKLVYPQPGVDPATFERLDFRHFLLQPMDGPEIVRNTKAAVDYCLAHPRWRLSLQTHKMIGVR
ncbi:7-carboxy-7-deazaguanine synthase [Methylocystis sp. WRRC1]|uniref:7-carboxy-7-deazaguanine synthase n=1 Tax=Methylocystis sp. WRRC1 TaxID=1732014 RepID=UPI001D15A796|nr:7-carboxy-7-deazaguanine synthase [Methylocystis sp. WRRC1]MCC3245672.1 7-carboxy-7-deazaguanine synthase [Methylocystis sp. WRRC1]